MILTILTLSVWRQIQNGSILITAWDFQRVSCKRSTLVWSNILSKVGIITLGMWFKALWSPNLIQNHNKKEFHTSFEINLFWGNVPPLQCITELPDDSNSQKSQKLFFPAMNWSKCTIVPENGGAPTFPHVFQIFWPRSLYHIPNVIIPTLAICLSSFQGKIGTK